MVVCDCEGYPILLPLLAAESWPGRTSLLCINSKLAHDMLFRNPIPKVVGIKAQSNGTYVRMPGCRQTI